VSIFPPVHDEAKVPKRDRPTREIDFTNGLEVCGFRAFDYFGDGTFYLLDAPGVSLLFACKMTS
jgi:hypothetical protein